MEIIAKQVERELQREQVDNVYYELIVPTNEKDIDGNDVVMAHSIGQYSLSQLNADKENLLNAIKGIDEKIAAINSLK